MKIRIEGFQATLPRLEPNLLPDSHAQIARNVDLHKGTIKSYKGLGQVINLQFNADVTTAYLWRINDSEYWFRFSDDVDVARSPIAEDETHRVYWTGDKRHLDSNGKAIPQMSYTPLAYQGGTQYPVASRQLGVPWPETAVSAQVQGTKDANTVVPERRYYVRTFVTDLGEEGPPADYQSSQISNYVDVYTGQTVHLTGLGLSVPTGTTSNIQKQRIYRAASGNSSADFYFVAEIPIAQTTYDDTRLTSELGETIPSTLWYAPPAGMQGLRLMANGVMVGFLGNEICFSEINLPHAWPPAYRLTVDYPIVAIGTYDTTVVVATEGRPFIITGSDPSSMAQRELPVNEACVSKRSMVSFGGYCVYASKNGLVYANQAGAQIVTDNAITREEWANFKPDTMRACEYRQAYVGFFGANEAETQGFIVSPGNASAGITTLSLKAKSLHRDPLKETLYLLDWQKNIAPLESGSRMTATWRSKVFETPYAGFNTLRLEMILPRTTQVRIYADESLHSAAYVKNDEPVRLPFKGKFKRWQVECITDGEIRSITLSERVSDT